MLKILIGLFCYFIAVSAGAIVGGVVYNQTEFNSENEKIQAHTVLLYNNENPASAFICSGTLIDTDIILTAAHCIPKTASGLWVYSKPEHLATSGKQAVLRAIAHPLYKAFKSPTVIAPNYDVGLVQFSGPSPEGKRFTKWIHQMNTNDLKFSWTAAGYGETLNGKGDTSILRIAKINIYDYSSMFNFFRADQTGGTGICKGDSGGPVYFNLANDYYVIGVSSGVTGIDANGNKVMEMCHGISFFSATIFYHRWFSEIFQIWKPQTNIAGRFVNIE